MQGAAINTDAFYEQIEELGKQLYVESQIDIPPDVRAGIIAAMERETSQVARGVVNTMLRAMQISDKRQTLVCQDTGFPIFFVTIGRGVVIDGTRLIDALTRGVERATAEHPLRSSIVSPITRENRQTSTGQGIPVIHVEFSKEIDYLDILMIPKGSGSENMSFLKMLVPSEGLAGVKRFVMEVTVGAGGKPCPPTIVGIGIGGTSDLCVLLAKKASIRPVGERHSDPQIAALEVELLEAINATGIGPMGLGGDTTALDVHIETAWTHITCNPVAVNMQCWRGERRRAKIYADGAYELSY
ncbi:MAG: fumarate hydratase [Candidatus Eremiobacteraeota bacterium]|nr:fumarate hydratase [Candidatus Eremiobacteraeota bacterium]